MRENHHVLYTSPDKRFFLIPDGRALATGPVVVRDLYGSVLRLSAEEATRWEVSERAARAIAEAEVRGLAERAEHALMIGRKVLDMLYDPEQDEIVERIRGAVERLDELRSR